MLTASSLARIRAYLVQHPQFSTMQAAEAYVRAVYAPFGPHSDAQWQFLTEHSLREAADGTLRLHFDPALAVAFAASSAHEDVELWSIYDGVCCPTLVLRGACSDVLTPETAAQMAVRGPRAQIVEVPGVGHAPTLMHDDQIDVVKAFLSTPEA